MTRRLAALRVGNFKAFADTQRIPLKPITLIFGPNSAGKSSFIHSLALAHEAQFGRQKRNLARLDVHRTDVGGSAIDLGGFRQYVYRGQLRRQVEWGAEITVASLDERMAQLLAPVSTITISLLIGMELDKFDRPRPGAEPRVESVELRGDDIELLRMSRRRTDSPGSTLRLDRLASSHGVFRQIVALIVKEFTKIGAMREDDFDGATEAIAALLPELQVHVAHFFPAAVELPRSPKAGISHTNEVIPVSKGSRREDVAQAVRLFLPDVLNELVKGIAEALTSELGSLQYLGPLRSFPARHLAFAENEDSNWYAGGGYAWDVVRSNQSVRDAVNAWLGADMLQTKYQLIVKAMVPELQVASVLEQEIEKLVADVEPNPAKFVGDDDFDSEEALSEKAFRERFDVADDPSGNAGDISNQFESWRGIDAISVATTIMAAVTSTAEHVNELVLIDQRNRTQVSHRDVGIGISQVLPVLVLALGSEQKLIAIEQPEIHLHPALQAELADVFIESAIGERQNTFILETHSEHLILRLLRRIRESAEADSTSHPTHPLRPEDVAVLYVKPEGAGARVVEIRISPDGEFVEKWPDGFFPERARELF